VSTPLSGVPALLRSARRQGMRPNLISARKGRRTASVSITRSRARHLRSKSPCSLIGSRGPGLAALNAVCIAGRPLKTATDAGRRLLEHRGRGV
jgi:hypothetical protein